MLPTPISIETAGANDQGTRASRPVGSCPDGWCKKGEGVLGIYAVSLEEAN